VPTLSRKAADRVSQLLVCVCPRDAFLFKQEAGAVVGRVLNEMRVKLLFSWLEVRQFMTDPNNYEIEPSGPNSLRGALLGGRGGRYLPSAK